MHITDPELVRSITHEWQGERDSGGRPLVAKDVIERMEMVTTEEAWGTLRRRGYHHSFAGGWKSLHPEKVLVGRAVTCRFVPKRVDLDDAVNSAGKAEARIGGQNSWVIDELKEDDVVVVDLFGKVRDGTFAGDNLSTAIKANTNRGMVVDGAIPEDHGYRWVQRVRPGLRPDRHRRRHAGGVQWDHPNR